MFRGERNEKINAKTGRGVVALFTNVAGAYSYRFACKIICRGYSLWGCTSHHEEWRQYIESSVCLAKNSLKVWVKQDKIKGLNRRYQTIRCQGNMDRVEVWLNEAGRPGVSAVRDLCGRKESAMKTVLAYYDIYPKVLCTGYPAEITISPLSRHVDFTETTPYHVRIFSMHETLLNSPEDSEPVVQAEYKDGKLHFCYHFATEQPYELLLEEKCDDKWRQRCELRVYALEPDLFALRPYRGDMHCHTCYSDGRESPDFVAAQYRKAGFDFLSITDHGQYEPSLKAIQTYESCNLSFRLFPGEEVHPPHNNIHTVHFGGDYSINDIFRNHPEQYAEEVHKIAESLDTPAGINKGEYASLLWVYDHIRAAGGLAVMVHPCWIQDHAFHVQNAMYRYLLEKRPFDALELTCGQSLEENQAQISVWQQMREEGHAVPIVGDSDSHGTINSDWFGISQMIVLAAACEKDALIEAVRARHTVVLEQYHGEPLPRLYGENRAVEFVLFLVTEYMPLHDELCYEEGRLMMEFANGSDEAGKALQVIGRRCDQLLEKYWWQNSR